MAILKLKVQEIEPAKSTVHHEGEAPGVLLVEYDEQSKTFSENNKYDWSNIIDLETSPPTFKNEVFERDWHIV